LGESPAAFIWPTRGKGPASKLAYNHFVVRRHFGAVPIQYGLALASGDEGCLIGFVGFLSRYDEADGSARPTEA
jgi:hypothetical protein